jgi:hypothetical protein
LPGNRGIGIRSHCLFEQRERIRDPPGFQKAICAH